MQNKMNTKSALSYHQLILFLFITAFFLLRRRCGALALHTARATPSVR
jgi:hypothetical protein